MGDDSADSIAFGVALVRGEQNPPRINHPFKGTNATRAISSKNLRSKVDEEFLQGLFPTPGKTVFAGHALIGPVIKRIEGLVRFVRTLRTVSSLTNLTQSLQNRRAVLV